MTLLEVLVAIGIAAALLTAAYRVIRNTLHQSETVRAARALEEEGSLILELMAEDLRHLPPLLADATVERFAGRMEGGLPRLDFVGARDSVATRAETASDLTEIGYRLKPLEDGSDRHRLERREDFFVDVQPLAGGTWTAVSEHVKELKLAYLPPTPPGGAPPAWQETFSNAAAQAPPAAVRIELTLSRTDPSNPQEIEEKVFRTIVLTFP